MKTCMDNQKRNLRMLGGKLVTMCLLLFVCTQLQAQTVEYIHTDALGSPIAVTDANQNVIERSEYAPYGDLLNRPDTDGPGYTGHVLDAATGLNYMQQRYYDPGIGTFLSVDPVAAYDNPVLQFNRYRYAANNPYKFKDPDGRIIDTIADIGFIGYDIYDISQNGLSWTSGAALGADVVGAVVPFATGLGAGVRATSHAGDAVKGAEHVVEAARGADKVADTGSAAGKLPKPPTGPGSVPKSERDPKRFFSNSEREAKRGEQGGAVRERMRGKT